MSESVMAAIRPKSDSQRSPLGELLDHIARSADMDGGLTQDARTSGSPAELKSLRYFRNSWEQLSLDRRLSQAQAQGPSNAGPLNSHLLVLESLKLMHDLSPDYLKRFMSYVDSLLWLEQTGGGGTAKEKFKTVAQRRKGAEKSKAKRRGASSV